MKFILFEKKGPIAWIILNRPKQRNALSLELMEEMQDQLNLVGKNRKIRVVIIMGKGPDFCSGHDMNELVGKNYNINHFRKIFSASSKLMQTLHHMPQPVIAQVHGTATAAGCQLVASSDLAIADSKTKFATPGVKIGLFCITPMVPLCRIIGRRKALAHILGLL